MSPTTDEQVCLKLISRKHSSCIEEGSIFGKREKQITIYKHSWAKVRGCTLHHAVGDADRLIVKKAVELPETTDSVLVSEDADLLVLHLHYASKNTRKIFLCPEPKQNAMRRSKVWDIQLCQQALGSDVSESILFIYAILGCDTTSSLYGIGKGLSLKAFMRKEQFKHQAITFSNELSSKEQIAGERA